jgi:hypothetical protein
MRMRQVLVADLDSWNTHLHVRIQILGDDFGMHR